MDRFYIITQKRLWVNGDVLGIDATIDNIIVPTYNEPDAGPCGAGPHRKSKLEWMMSIDLTTLQGSIQRLFPELDADEVLAELLLERARRNLIKYRTMARDFEAKYNMDFETFRHQTLDSEPAFEAEQDYFDWEMAVTGIEDMQEEIARLQSLSKS
jgi:hypothetical protein